MTDSLPAIAELNLLAVSLVGILETTKNLLLVFIGFSLVIFVHELGHFMAAKWCDVRVDKFAVGFGKALFSWRKGLGFRWGSTYDEYRKRLLARVEANRGPGPTDPSAEPSDEELSRAAREIDLGETEYCFNALPLGGYVKMLGQEDFTVDKSGELMVRHDPRAFTHKPIRQRMLIVSAGVVMNLVFAALVFAVVFMWGLPSPAAEVGMVLPGSPADKAGLMPGDVITRINGREVSDQADLKAAVVLSDPYRPVSVAFKRKDPATGAYLSQTLSIRAEVLPGDDTRKLGVSPPMTLKIGLVLEDPDLPPEEQLRKEDEIVAVNGRAVSDFYEFGALVADSWGEWLELTVKRPAGDGQGEPTPVRSRMRGRLILVPPAAGAESVLGFVPRLRFNDLDDSGAVAPNRLRRGDVVVRWGGVLAPRFSEIRKSIESNVGKVIPVTVLRGGEEQTVNLTIPSRSGGVLLADGQWNWEPGPVVIADVVAEGIEGTPTPAAQLKNLVPRGSLLTRVNDEPVSSWGELIRRFYALAGTDVKISWVYEGTPEQSGTIHVPRTLDTALGLPPASIVKSIAGRDRVEVEVNGRRDSYQVNNQFGQRAVLKDLVGKTVRVEYELLLEPGTKTAEVAIEPDMLVPWTRQFVFGEPRYMATYPKKILIQERNPLKAVKVGMWKTYYSIEQVYLMMQRMLITRSVSMDQVSGPVGIFKIGGDVAGEGLVYLLFFLAIISANLAVINFLPLPIVDGGLFVFLLIEWIKGRPVSLKVQVVTQVIGLALIVSVFVYVTFKDVTKLW
ncbi:MAG: hypothetical protein AMXMBFR83_05400 [Phycisphaerae bacterium]